MTSASSQGPPGNPGSWKASATATLIPTVVQLPRRSTRSVRILRDRRASLQSLDVDSAVKKEERKKKITPTASPKVTKGKGQNCPMWVILLTAGQHLHSICLLLAKANRPHLDTMPPVPEGVVLRVPHPGNIRSRDLSMLGWSRATTCQAGSLSLGPSL